MALLQNFGCGLACAVLQKSHLCGWLKIVFKKCAVGKNKNTEALAFRSAVCWFICPVTLCLFLSFILAVSFFRLAGNLLLHATTTPFNTYSGEISASLFKILIPNILENIPNQSKFQSYSHVSLFLFKP
jgi:hypothetical protein